MIPLIKKIIKRLIVLFNKDAFSAGITKEEIKDLIDNPEATVLEIGCADGLDTLEFLKVFASPGFRIFCFEPDPRNIASFKRLVRDTRARLIEAAIADHDGRLTLNQSSTIYSSSLKEPNLANINARWPEISFENQVEVEAVTLDTFLENEKIETVDFIWADVQGAEDLMIKGGRASLNARVRYLYTEYSNDQLYQGEPTDHEIVRLLGPNWKLMRRFHSDLLFKNTNIP